MWGWPQEGLGLKLHAESVTCSQRCKAVYVGQLTARLILTAIPWGWEQFLSMVILQARKLKAGKELEVTSFAV